MAGTIEIQFNQAFQDQMNGDFENALKGYNAVLEMDASHYPALNNIGIIALMNGNIEKAIETFKKIMELSPGFPDAYYNLGKAYMIAGNFGQSLQFLQKAQTLLEEEDSSILKNTGICQFKLNKIHESLCSLKKALVHQKTDPEVFYYLAECSYSVEQYSDALKWIDQAIDLDSEKGMYYHLKAKTALALNLFDQARAAAEESILLEPKNESYYHCLAQIYEQSKQTERAIQTLERLNSICPDALVADLKRGILERTEKVPELKSASEDEIMLMYQQAIIEKEYKKGISKLKKLSGPPILKIKTADLMLADRQVENARILYNSVLHERLNPALTDYVRVRHCRCVLESGNVQKALNESEEIKSTFLGAVPAEYYILRADIFHSLRQYEHARENLEEYIAVKDDNYSVNEKYIEILIKCKDYNRALAECEKMMRGFKEETEPYYLMAYVYYLRRDYSPALNYCMLYLKQLPESFRGYELKFMILLKLKKVDDARKSWKTITGMQPREISEILIQAKAFLFSDQTDSAEAGFRIVYEEEPQNAESLYYYGLLKLVREQVKDAAELWIKAWKEDTLVFRRECDFIFKYFNPEKLQLITGQIAMTYTESIVQPCVLFLQDMIK